MQKWEYLFLVASWHDDWKIETANGANIQNWEYGPTMYEYLNQLGEQGWEIINTHYHTTFNEEGHIPDELYEHYRIALKRILPDSSG